MARNNILTISQSKHQLVIELMIVCLGSCFLALMSQLSIPLPLTPIPLTLQTLAVFLLGGVLGGRRRPIV